MRDARSSRCRISDARLDSPASRSRESLSRIALANRSRGRKESPARQDRRSADSAAHPRRKNFAVSRSDSHIRVPRNAARGRGKWDAPLRAGDRVAGTTAVVGLDEIKRDKKKVRDPGTVASLR